jgi:lipoate-protein ligase A
MGLNKPFDEVKSNLKEAFSERFSSEIVVGNLTTEEEESTKKLTEEKYTSDKWNGKKKFTY